MSQAPEITNEEVNCASGTGHKILLYVGPNQIGMSYPQCILIIRRKFLIIGEKKNLEGKVWKKNHPISMVEFNKLIEGLQHWSAIYDLSFYFCSSMKFQSWVGKSEIQDFLHWKRCLLFLKEYKVLSGSIPLRIENQGFGLALGHPWKVREVTCWSSGSQMQS